MAMPYRNMAVMRPRMACCQPRRSRKEEDGHLGDQAEGQDRSLAAARAQEEVVDVVVQVQVRTSSRCDIRP